MRVRSVFVALSAAALGSVVYGAGPASAGASDDATLQVVKQVVGDFPDGTVFVVSVTCAGGNPVEIQFDDEGAPITPGSNIISTDISASCFIQETSAGGATSTLFGCSDNSESYQLPAGTTCKGLDSNVYEVNFDDVDESGVEATVTITNTADNPQTGADTGPAVVLGLALVGAGLALASVTRLRRARA